MLWRNGHLGFHLIDTHMYFVTFVRQPLLMLLFTMDLPVQVLYYLIIASIIHFKWPPGCLTGWPNAQKTLYVEGTSVTSSISVPAPVSKTSPVFLMRRGGTIPNWTAGELRDLLFFNIAISSSQQNQISSQLEMLYSQSQLVSRHLSYTTHWYERRIHI